MDVEAELQTPRKTVEPETGNNEANDNPFSPLAARTTETRDRDIIGGIPSGYQTRHAT